MSARSILKFRLRLTLFLVCGLASLNHFNSAVAETNPSSSVVGGETQFAFDLYNQLKSNDGNLFFSPYSISTCLGMTYVGARGNTAKQMAKVLHFDVRPEELPTPMGALEKQLNEIRQGGRVELNTANGLWAQTGHPFSPSFLQACRQDFGARIVEADFRAAIEPARKEINNWVAKQTKEKIKDLIQPGVIDSSTRLVLVNAIYFKGRWVRQFAKNMTAELPFFVAPDHEVQARFMHQKASFNYAESEAFQLLEMNYEGESPSATPLNSSEPGAKKSSPPLSMVILLPKQRNGLKQLEESLNELAVNLFLAQAHVREVNVTVPKFTMTRQFDLAQTLSSMGMSDAFSSQADFSGMDGERDLSISMVVHKAFVDVNEEGTEAAAATGVGMHRLAVMATPEFRADHPFIFFIRDTRSGSILFLGRVTDPTK